MICAGGLPSVLELESVTLFTFGYEGLSIQSFVDRLRVVDVKIVIDVRALPLSRKAGFSKRSFNFALCQANIGYRHMPALGCPKSIRKRFKQDGDWTTYSNTFSIYLAGQREAVSELALIAQKSCACLVCFETDFNKCHRSIVARAAVRSGAPKVMHLTSKTEILDDLLPAAA